MKLPILVILAGVLALSMTAAPAFADNSGAHSVTVSTTISSDSCSSPIPVTGTATGANILHRQVKLKVVNVNTGQVVAYGKAKASGGTYSTSLSIASSNYQEGYFVVVATWYGQVAQTDTEFYWAC